MSNTNLSKIIEKILNRIRGEKTLPIPEETRHAGSTAPTSPIVSGVSDLESPPSNLSSQVSENKSEKLIEKTPKKVYLKAFPLKSIEDLNMIKHEVTSGNILILRVSPLAKKSVDDVRHVVSELCEFTQSLSGDIARLGQERIVITPSFVKIWREKAKTSEVESTAA